MLDMPGRCEDRKRPGAPLQLPALRARRLFGEVAASVGRFQVNQSATLTLLLEGSSLDSRQYPRASLKPQPRCVCRKETHCEFCDSTLPDWKSTLTPVCGADAPAVMNVNFDGQTYSFEVKPGSAGYKQFTQAIREAFSLPEDSELNITFTCDEPSQGMPPLPYSPDH